MKRSWRGQITVSASCGRLASKGRVELEMGTFLRLNDSAGHHCMTETSQDHVKQHIHYICTRGPRDGTCSTKFTFIL